MQLRPHPKGGFAVWLNDSEAQRIIDYWEENAELDNAMEKKIAVKCMYRCGLRADDLKNVTRGNIRRLDTEDEAYVLRVEESKRGYRETPLPVELKTEIMALAGAKGLKQDERVFQLAKRTYQRAVENVVPIIAEETGDDDWELISAHDLRRSWATRCYYKLGGTERDLRAVMSWGGWSKRDTFEDHYLGVIPEDLLSEMMEEADLR